MVSCFCSLSLIDQRRTKVIYAPLRFPKQILGCVPFLLDTLVVDEGHTAVGSGLEIVNALAELPVSQETPPRMAAHLGNQLSLLMVAIVNPVVLNVR